MRRCVSTDVGTWMNWLTFEPDPDYTVVRMPQPDCFPGYRMRCNAEFYYAGKISRIGIGRLSLQRRVVLKWFYSPRAVWTTLSEVHALHRVPFWCWLVFVTLFCLPLVSSITRKRLQLLPWNFQNRRTMANVSLNSSGAAPSNGAWGEAWLYWYNLIFILLQHAEKTATWQQQDCRTSRNFKSVFFSPIGDRWS